MSRSPAAAARTLAAMVAGGLATRGALCRHFGLSKGTVSRTVERLRRRGFLEEGPCVRHFGRGRPAVSLQVRPDLAYMVGADLEGMAMRVCILDSCRRLVSSRRQALDPGWSAAEIMRHWCSLLREVIGDSGLPRDRIAGLGVGLPAILSRDVPGLAGGSPRRHWVETAVGGAFADLGLPVAAANNTLCVSEYELRVGVMRAVPSFISVLTRYGIGAAIYSHGAFVVGQEAMVGELGHMQIARDGPLCVCGRRGCLDTFCSGRTWPPEEARTGTAWEAELAAHSEYLGIGLANLLTLVPFPVLVLNGMYNDYEARVRPALEAVLDRELAPLGLPVPRLVFGEPVEFKSSVGAALRAAATWLEPFLERTYGAGVR